MNFTIIEPAESRIRIAEAREPWELYPQLGLSGVDHGVVAPGFGIIVGEFSLFVPPEDQRYFTIGRCLYAGNAVLYGFDEAGETIDILDALSRAVMPPVIFISLAGIEKAIAAGQIDRPVMAANDVQLWQWPEPPPPFPPPGQS